MICLAALSQIPDMFFPETDAENYDWETGIYILQEYDPVEGGPEGISNVQAKVLALRTRNLHERVKQQEQKIAELEIQIQTLLNHQS